MRKLRVMLVDDHALVRSGFRALLERIADVEVVAETVNGREAEVLVARFHPDIVLMDISMPEMNGLEATARIVAADPRVKVIILSMYTGEQHVEPALRAGAAGYLVKDATAADLEAAITAVARGETYLSPAVSRHVVAGYVRGHAAEPSSLERLTPRQREILQLIAEGHTTKDIAARLGLGVSTVETHRAQLMERVDIHDVAGLVRYAVRMGLVTPDH